jgi:hypothetical protein
MSRPVLTLLLMCLTAWSLAQSKQISLGVFSGIVTSYTWDQGIYNDSRYKARYDVKFAPFGVAYGLDYEGFGFVFNPSIVSIGQNFYTLNTVGGHEGLRKINMKYLDLPIGIKLHMIDLSFFRVSLVAGAGIGYLMKGEETISHNNAKFRFPEEVYPALPPDYIVEYDGVLAPKVKDFSMLAKKDFNGTQFFGSFGIRSDWDVTSNWRVTLDVRANYGVLETRSDAYLKQVLNHQTLYDIAGKRREIFAYLNIGIARFVDLDVEGSARFNFKNSRKKFTPRPKLPPIRKN